MKADKTPKTVDKQSSLLAFLQDSLMRVSDWTKFADAKAGAVLVVLGLMVSNALSNAGRLHSAYELDGWLGNFISIFFWCSMIAATLSVTLTVMSLFPRVKPKTKSIAYFGTIADQSSASKYLRQLKKMDISTLEEQLANQNWEVSRIAQKKYQLIMWAYRSTLLFLITYVTSRICYWVATL